MTRTCLISAAIFLLMSLANAQRLPSTTTPENYKLTFSPDLAKNIFTGEEIITVQTSQPTSEIVLNAVDIDFQEVTVSSGNSTQKAKVTLDKENEQAKLTTDRPLPAERATISCRRRSSAPRRSGSPRGSWKSTSCRRWSRTARIRGSRRRIGPLR